MAVGTTQVMGVMTQMMGMTQMAVERTQVTVGDEPDDNDFRV